MQSIIYSTICTILFIEAAPHVHFYNEVSKSKIIKGNTGIIIKPDNTFIANGYKICSRTADLSKYGENNFKTINSSKVKINVRANYGQLLHVPNSGPGWRTKNEMIIKSVLEGDTYITDNDCGLTAYYSEEGELLYFKNNGIIKKNVFLNIDNLSDRGTYYEYNIHVWLIKIDKLSGKLSPNLMNNGTTLISTDTSSSESEKDDALEYETADSECSHISKSDETREKYESNVSPIPSASDYDTYSSTSSESKDDSSTSSGSKDDTYSSTSPESEDDTYSSISSKREDDTYSSTSSESKDNTYSSNDHHTDKFSDNKIRKRFVFVDTQ